MREDEEIVSQGVLLGKSAQQGEEAEIIKSSLLRRYCFSSLFVPDSHYGHSEGLFLLF